MIFFLFHRVKQWSAFHYASLPKITCNVVPLTGCCGNSELVMIRFCMSLCISVCHILLNL